MARRCVQHVLLMLAVLLLAPAVQAAQAAQARLQTPDYSIYKRR